jgi:hypothetical protein
MTTYHCIMTAEVLNGSDRDLALKLGQTFWSWNLCEGCYEGQECTSQDCPGPRIHQLRRYLQYYGAVVATYSEERSTMTKSVHAHQDILTVISKLKSHPDATRTELCQLISPSTDPKSCLPDHGDAVTLAAKLLLMIDPSPLHHSSDRLEMGTFRVHWKDDVPLSKFVKDIFPIGNHHVFSHPNSELFAQLKSEIRATNLKKRLRMEIRATSDIQNHLRIDRRRNVLEVYHYTAFLKEQLRATKNYRPDSNPSPSIKRLSLSRTPYVFVLANGPLVIYCRGN